MAPATVSVRAGEAALVDPPLVAVAVKLCAPSASTGVVKVQTPLLFVVAVPSAVAPS